MTELELKLHKLDDTIDSTLDGHWISIDPKILKELIDYLRAYRRTAIQFAYDTGKKTEKIYNTQTLVDETANQYYLEREKI